MIAFSVPMTDASSRYMRVPRRPVGRELVDAVDMDVGAESGERVDVRVEASPADHVATGRRHGHASEAREERTGEQERRANLAREVGVEVRLARCRPGRPGPRSSAVHSTSAPRSAMQLDHRLDVADSRDVREPHLVRREQRRGENRKRAVLVPRGAHGSRQGAAAFDDEGLHRARNATGGFHVLTGFGLSSGDARSASLRSGPAGSKPSTCP